MCTWNGPLESGVLPSHHSDDKVHVQDLLYGMLLLTTSAVDQRSRCPRYQSKRET